MKKIFLKLFVLIGLLILPYSVLAAGGVNVSRESISMDEGGTASFQITASNAAGNIVVSSSNSAVASVSTGSVWIDNETITVNVTGKSAGTATITVSLADVATYDEEVLSGSRTVTVTVNKKVEQNNNNNNNNNNNSNNNHNNNSNNNNNNSQPADNRSSNSNLSKLIINGKEVSKKDNNYVLEVGNYVSNVDISGTAEDSKAKVSGTGKKDLKVGENTFDVVVTAENGKTTTYKVIITRSEYNVISDLDELLKLNKDVEIKLSDEDKLSKDILDKIIKSKNKVTLNKISDDKKVLYSWILDGKELKGNETFNPNITLLTDSNEDMEEAMNYADGIYLDFSKCGDIPEGAILKYFVGDKYKDGDKINLYIYDEKEGKVKQLESNIEVTDGYVELRISDSVKHVITKAKVVNATSSKEEINIWFIVSIILIILVFGLLVFLLMGKKKNKEEVVDLEKNSVSSVEEKVMPVVENTNEVYNSEISDLSTNVNSDNETVAEKENSEDSEKIENADHSVDSEIIKNDEDKIEDKDDVL